MAETINKSVTSTTHMSATSTDLNRSPTGKKYYYWYGEVATDAAASDTTLFSVPAGKTFYLTQASGQQTTSGGTLRLYDASGDSVSGASSKCTLVMSIYASQLANTLSLIEPMPFTKGVTIAGADQTASQTKVIELQGYLV